MTYQIVILCACPNTYSNMAQNETTNTRLACQKR